MCRGRSAPRERAGFGELSRAGVRASLNRKWADGSWNGCRRLRPRPADRAAKSR
jgi:hypothetical protein